MPFRGNQPDSLAAISSQRKRLAIALRMSVPTLLALSILALATYQYGVHDARRSLLWQDHQASNHLQYELESGVHSVISDVRFLAQEVSASILFEQEPLFDPESLRRLEKSMLNFSRSRGLYDQIRFLDKGGQEIVRVNFDDGKAVIVESSKLQNKALRNYFQESMLMERGEIFVSSFDLNMEHGLVEQPIKPMIRFGSPVFGSHGNQVGVVVLNYFGENLLSMLQDFQLSNQSTSYLINSSGYYLKGPDSAYEWTFMFPDLAQKTFADDHPEVWSLVQDEGAGQFEIEDGLFTVRPIHFGKNEKSLSTPKWQLIVYASAENLAALDARRAKIIFTFSGGLGLLLALGSWVLAGSMLGRRYSESRLAANRKHLASIFDTARDAILSFDANHRIVFWNRSAQKLFHYTEEEAKNLDFDTLLAPGLTLKKLQQSRGDDNSSGTFEEEALIEFLAIKSGNEVFPAEMSLSSWHTESGYFSTVIMRDITERNRAELDLMQAIEEAHQASMAKSNFLANMSHEIRTPMNGVIGMAELLADTELDVQQRRLVKTITSSGDSLLGLINDILDISKIESGKMEVEVNPFNLRSLLEEVTDLFAASADAKGLEFAGFLDLDVFEFVKGDLIRLRQVLTNLVGNALKFTEHGEVVIRGRLVSEDAQKLMVRFDIRDTGIGIAEDAVATLFDSFTQEDVSTTRKFGGAGLGLSISKMLVDLMDGEISVESVKGEGATFRFTLPLEKQAQEEVESPCVPADLKEKRVLVVDNHAFQRETLRLQLEFWGCQVEEANCAEVGLAKFAAADAREEPFHILIVDMQIPGMGGEEFGRRIAAQKTLLRPLMTILTSIDDRGDAQRANASGFHACLTKPVKQGELRDCLTTLVAKVDVLGCDKLTPPVGKHSVGEGKRFHMRVLLADDNKVNLMVASSMLKKLGAEVETAENGRVAVEMLAGREKDFALVLMDCQMPEMDGFEATSMIRQSETDGVRIPVVALTAHALHGDREKCLQAGMDDYLTKPLKLSSLRDTLERWS